MRTDENKIQQNNIVKTVPNHAYDDIHVEIWENKMLNEVH